MTSPTVLVGAGRHHVAVTVFAYRSPYAGPLSKHIRRLPDPSGPHWFRRGWFNARDDPEAWPSVSWAPGSVRRRSHPTFQVDDIGFRIARSAVH